MAFSAADLQKQHQELEGAPDPFPALAHAPVPVAKKVQSAPAPLDTSSEDAFPSLAAPSAPSSKGNVKPAISMWASKSSAVKTGVAKPMAPGGLGRTGTPTAGSHPFAETFSIPANELVQGKAASDVVKKVQDQTGAIVESSTQMRTGLKTFHVKAADQKKLAQAKRMIEGGLRKPVTVQVEVPITTLGTIIGPKGATLKGITDATGAKVDVPRRETLPSYTPKDNGSDAGSDDEDGEPQVSITISGPATGCTDAKDRILSLISHKVSQTSTSIKTIPSAFYTIISTQVSELEQGPGEGKVTVKVPIPAVWKALERQAQADAEGEKVVVDGEAPIKVKGDRENVKAVIDEITKSYDSLVQSFNLKKVSIPKRQHRFLIGSAAEDILAQTGCVVELPPVDDPSDRVVIRGPPAKLVAAQSLVFEKANAVSVEPLDLVSVFRRTTSDPVTHATNILRYLRASKLKDVSSAYPNVQIFPPFPSTVANTGTVIIEIVSEDGEEVSKVVDEITNLAKGILPSAVSIVQVDHLAHSLLVGKKGTRIAQFEKTHNVTVVFPPASEESSNVLLVYTGPADKDVKLEEVFEGASKDLTELAKEVADIKTEILEVEKKWHKYIIGQNGSVLNAIIGEDALVSVKVGTSTTKFPSTGSEDSVTIRGPRNEVDRVTKQIKQVVEDAKNDDIVNGYTVKFDVEKKYVPHLVGQAGAAINKLRETLGVKVNFEDAPEKETKKGAKKVLVNCSIVGRKEPVEEAKKRLIAQIEKLEDETTEVLSIKRAIQPALIGAGGKYAIRLEEKYGVKLSFPRDSKDKESGANPDQVTIRGGRKGVAAVKAELLEAAAFETESRQEATFKVPSKAVAQIVGKGGATINAIKNDTGAQIDIEREGGEDKQTTITVRGDKQAIAAAKEAVLNVVKEVGDEITVELTIEQKYHRNLIGQGGQNLRDLIASAGGPSEGYKQAGLVTFPKNGDESTDKVRLRGDSKVVKKIQTELEKQVAVLKDTIVIGVVVPATQHATKIGRGGMALQDLQRKTGAVIHFPGSRQYSSIGEIENQDDLEGVSEGDIVKVIGTKEVTQKAAELLQVTSERGQRSDSRQGRATPDLVSCSVSIPNKYYHAIAETPNLIRQIRAVGGYLNIPQPAPAKPSLKRPEPTSGDDLAAKTARIDLDGDETVPDVQGEWSLVKNFEGADDEKSEWVVRAKEEDLERAVKVLEQALEKARKATHVGYLTGLPRSAFPRIIGSKGATISRMRLETGADIQVGKEDDLITIIGDEESVLQAKDAILSIVSRPSRERY
ncbi:hypothetical protein C349_05122 [Cryptococcus neoformans var. grubii Br795]|nr:hypothetical protein C353_05088 [Cryptococcus neoformans var. grubii AD1-83a]OWZ52300.1 hypothetical protein C368_05347 [Cryptococcus neoformans var. grubii 125.91]OXG47396.1 hypothetical protein C355_05057 [Cryptococcus neoformans var. grubii Th84]OXG53430.1 hypothetical protein C354_05026 [Cryptococcus neoformans var. grubii MW-RSA1955]OXG56826.1 hypothetical protein C352_05005 [Cryptococcus neoformans var. grubii CHC193]OXG60268.1 hypothetical protein C351_04970 [Cryptococcus neoformans 